MLIKSRGPPWLVNPPPTIRKDAMSIIRFVIDLESEGDLTQDEMAEMTDTLNKHADSVVGPQKLAEKQGDDGHATFHVHRSNNRQACPFCLAIAADERGA